MGTRPLTPTLAQGLLRDALGDPTLELLLWSADRGRYLDVDGATAELPADRTTRAVTVVGGHESLTAALVHDPSPSFDDGSGVVEGLALTTLLLLDRKQLVDELRASRARIAESAQEERVRLEHDIHDGVQQRLLALQMRAAEARKRAPPGLVARIAEIQNDALTAVEDLRAISRGLIAPALASNGVEAGLHSLALTLPIPLRVRSRGVGRYPPSTEAAVYFCMVEAVQNSMKHAGAGAKVTITLRGEPGRLSFECADEGGGFVVGRRGGLPRAPRHARPDRGRRRRARDRVEPVRDDGAGPRPDGRNGVAGLIRVAVAEDSLLVREGIVRILDEAEGVEVVGAAR